MFFQINSKGESLEYYTTNQLYFEGINQFALLFVEEFLSFMQKYCYLTH